MKKLRYGIIGFVVLVCIGWGAYHVLNQPPSLEYLKKHPEAFRFEDYKKEVELEEALQTLFPIGTKREYIETFLIDHVGVQLGYSSGATENYYITYYLPNQYISICPTCADGVQFFTFTLTNKLSIMISNQSWHRHFSGFVRINVV